MTLLRVVYHMIAAWWWGLAVDHVHPGDPDLLQLCARRKRHADRVIRFLREGVL